MPSSPYSSLWNLLKWIGIAEIDTFLAMRCLGSECD
jgi:hypothetical protein